MLSTTPFLSRTDQAPHIICGVEAVGGETIAPCAQELQTDGNDSEMDVHENGVPSTKICGKGKTNNRWSKHPHGQSMYQKITLQRPTTASPLAHRPFGSSVPTQPAPPLVSERPVATLQVRVAPKNEHQNVQLLNHHQKKYVSISPSNLTTICLRGLCSKCGVNNLGHAFSQANRPTSYIHKH